MSLLIRYTHIPFYFRFSFTFSTLSIHHYAPLLQHNHTHTCMTFALASSDWSHLFDGHMIYDSHVCASSHGPTNHEPSHHMVRYFPSDEPYALFPVFHLYLTCLYLPFSQIIIREEPTNHLYQFPLELRFSTYTLHHLALISHHFASHHTASQSHFLYPTAHLETMPFPQIAPPQSLIGFILRSPAP